ncbi:MAG: hypothetical protein L6Q75_09620 [Burkholderiaceae bacterium]|nr:hypothetical protein [Burkholderiaceae bacterium]
MHPLALLLLVLAALPAQAARNAILEIECSHPAAAGAGPAAASAGFESSERREAVSVLHLPTAAALQKELAARATVPYARVDDAHYASRDGRHTLRQVEKSSGPIGPACDEVVAALIARFDQKDPEDLRAVPSVELYLLDGLSRHRWELVDKQWRDRSTPSLVKTNATYYLRRPD